jgi:YVTN family beta-propeller protein
MAVFDTGPIDNRDAPRTTQLAIRLFNTGRKPAIAGVEAYHINPTGDGFASETLYVVELVSLNPFGTSGSSFTVDNVFANLDVFGVRALTSGLGANDIAVTVLEKGADGQIIKEHVLEGELSRIEELLFAYVANFTTDTVSVIDTGTNTMVDTVTLPAGSNPRGIAITPDGSRVYVTNEGNDMVSVINTGTNTIVDTVMGFPPGSNPRAIAITPDGSRAYVANQGDNTVSVIDTETNTIVDIVNSELPPNAIAITPDGSKAYITYFDALNDLVTVIDTGTNDVEAVVPFPIGSRPVAIAITPDGSRAYVANLGSPDTLDSVTVIDTGSNMIEDTVDLPDGSNPTAIVITPDGTRAYVTNLGNDTVSVIHTGNNNIVDTVNLPAGSEPVAIAITPDGSRVYVANLGPETVSVIDTANNTVVATLPVVSSPTGIAITPILLF